jgi:hypothetical protein
MTSLSLSLHISLLDDGAHSTDSRQWTGTSKLMRCGGRPLRVQWQGLHNRGICFAEWGTVSGGVYTIVRHQR